MLQAIPTFLVRLIVGKKEAALKVGLFEPETGCRRGDVRCIR